MSTPTLKGESPSVPIQTGAANGGPGQGATRRPAFGRGQLAFLIGIPLAWAVLLWFHPDVPDPDNVYAGLRDDATAYQIVHVGTLIFIGLMGVALYMLVRDLPGKAARISRLAIGPFVLFYGAWETVIGLATGALVQHANDLPAGQRPAVSDAIQALGSNAIVGEVGALAIAGGLAWITAVIAAAVALGHAGAPLLATVLLGLSLIVISHPPPIGPIGLVCFAGAVALLARDRRLPAGSDAAAMVRGPEPLGGGGAPVRTT
jgi:hypothetical protein